MASNSTEESLALSEQVWQYDMGNPVCCVIFLEIDSANECGNLRTVRRLSARCSQNIKRIGTEAMPIHWWLDTKVAAEHEHEAHEEINAAASGTGEGVSTSVPFTSFSLGCSLSDPISSPLRGSRVPDSCRIVGCKAAVPDEMADQRMCVLHFSLIIEHECAEIRRQTALGNTSHERQVEFIRQIGSRSKSLVSAALNGFPLTDELKTRILSTVLTLMNCRESMDRATLRHPGGF
jgi:hypothetical protein